MIKKLLSLFGLKWNPFAQEVPIEALLKTAAIESFCWRIEQVVARSGGFVLITGASGLGKSATLRLLGTRLGALRDVTVGYIQRPSSNVADFYREMGEIFGVNLKPHNRWCGFKMLRERWQAHIETTLLRPILLIDEAQEATPAVLNELRLMSSTDFDSRSILTVGFAADARFIKKLETDDLAPLGTRIHPRLTLSPLSPKELMEYLKHRLQAAGNPRLMTPEVMTTLCEHAMGNPRILLNAGEELLAVAAERELTQIDEKLYLEYFEAARRSVVLPARGKTVRK